MAKSNILERLISNVMSERQAKVYLALLENSEAGAAELQRASGIPFSKISETVGHLVNYGYISAKKVGRKKIYEVIDPEVTMKSNIAQLESQIKILTDLTKDLADIYKQRGQSEEAFEYIKIIHGNENIHNNYIELLKTAEFEVLSFTRPPFAAATKKMQEEQYRLFLEFLKRGGKSKTIFEVIESSDGRIFQHIKNSIEDGDIFRIAPKLPLKMFIFDRKVLLIANQSSLAGSNELSMTVVKQETTVEGYIALFNFIWDQAQEYEDWIKGRENLMERKLAEWEKSFK